MAALQLAPGRVKPVSRANRLQTNSTEYQEVVSWEVKEGTEGDLFEISLVSNEPDVTQYRLTINGEVQWEDRFFPMSLKIPFRENDLPQRAQALLEARSTDVLVIVTVDGHISGEEREMLAIPFEALPEGVGVSRLRALPGIGRKTLRAMFPPRS